MRIRARAEAILLAGLAVFQVIHIPMPQAEMLQSEEVWMSTDKACYRPGELVRITATGRATVPSIGDFATIFWAITNESGGLVFETFNPFTAIGYLNGTLSGTWNQTYRRFYGSQPPTGTPVPKGRYTIWFYTPPDPYWYPETWHPTNVTIGDDCPGNLVADAGLDQTILEGESVVLRGTHTGGKSSVPIPLGKNVKVNSVDDFSGSAGTSGGTRAVLDGNGTAFVTWTDGRDDLDIYFNKAPLEGGFPTDVRVDDLPPGYGSYFSDIAVGTDSKIHVAWYTGDDILYSRSVDDGVSFSPHVVLSEAHTPGIGNYPARLAKGTNSSVHSAWGGVSYRYSPDGGASWDTSLKLEEGGFPDMEVGEDGSVYMVYAAMPPGFPRGAIMFSRKPAGGSFSTPIPVRPLNGSMWWYPALALGPAGEVFVAWYEADNVTQRILFASSLDGGKSFSAPIVVRETAIEWIVLLCDPSVSAFGANGVAVGWVEYLEKYKPFTESRVSVSIDGGKSFGAYGRIDDDVRRSGKIGFTIAGNRDGALFAAWCDYRLYREPELQMGGSIYGAWIGLSSNASSATYEWDFDDGVDGNGDGNYTNDADAMGQNTTHIYGDDGEYVTTLTVRDASGNTAMDTVKTIVLNVAPSVAFTVIPSGDEGNSLTFKARVTDPGSDDIVVTWSGSCTGWSLPATYFNDPAGFPDPNPSPDVNPRDITDSQAVVCGDNGVFVWSLLLEDDDGGETKVWGEFPIANVPPTYAYTYCPQIVGCFPTRYEGANTDYWVMGEDAGSDDLTYGWKWGDGTLDESATYYNDGIGPDPPNSPNGTYPFYDGDNRSHAYGDDGTYEIVVVESDDDGGVSPINASVTVLNLPPSVTVTGGMNIDEGQTITLTAAATDPGSDDLTFEWSWGDGSSETRIYYDNGVSPDLPQSPGGKWPFSASDTATHVYGDNGIYPIILTVSDDDGGSTSWSSQATVRNVLPTIAPFGPFIVNEGDPLSITATAKDAGSDDLSFRWRWDYGSTDTATFYNNGIGPDPPQSPGGTYPFTATDSSSHTYGDDCPCNVTLTVTDDDGGTATYTTIVNVLNLPPSLEGKIEAYARGSLVLRVAGEKYHDVTAKVFLNGVEKYTATVVRVPGSPDEQAVTLGDIAIDLTSNDTWSARLVYTPLDDPINGRVWGATPSWLVFRSEHGSESRTHHTFNARHEDTWKWDIPDLRALLVGIPLDFQATASDPGSDDLTFTWDWGDGTPVNVKTYFNDGVGPDPYPSPELSPIIAADTATHAFITAGLHTVTLTVTDDDGGAGKVILVITLT